MLVTMNGVGSHGFCIPWKDFYIGWTSAQAAKWSILKTPRMRVTIQREISGPCTRKLTGISTQLPNVD